MVKYKLLEAGITFSSGEIDLVSLCALVPDKNLRDKKQTTSILQKNYSQYVKYLYTGWRMNYKPIKLEG